MAKSINGIYFKDLSKIGQGSAFNNVINGDVRSESDLQDYIDAGEEYKNIQSVLINWNGADLKNVDIPATMTTLPRRLQTTGELLMAIAWMNNRITNLENMVYASVDLKGYVVYHTHYPTSSGCTKLNKEFTTASYAYGTTYNVLQYKDVFDKSSSDPSNTILIQKPEFIASIYNTIKWNTRADGNGTDYGENSSFEINDTVVHLYAIWTYEGDTELPHDSTDIITPTPSTEPTDTNTATPTDGNDGGQTFSTYAIYLNYQGGTYTGNSSRTITGAVGTRNSLFDRPVKAGYVFDGWMDINGNTYDIGAVITMPNYNMTLYAQYKASTATNTQTPVEGVSETPLNESGVTPLNESGATETPLNESGVTDIQTQTQNP